MNNLKTKKEIVKTTKYELAGATRRIFARFFDGLLVLIALIGIFIGVFYDEIFVQVFSSENSLYNIGRHILNNAVSLALGWKLSLYCGIIILVHFLYFVVLPFLWNGQTLFKKSFKIRTIERKNKKYFFWHLILKESFIWFFQIIFLTIPIFILNNEVTKDNAASIFSIKDSGIFGNTLWISIVFGGLGVIGIFVSFAFFITLMIRTKRLSPQDIMSGTAVILSESYFKKVPKEWRESEIDLPELD